MRELLERLFQVDFIKGLLVTFRMQNPKEIVTEQYPLERPMVAERYRGAPRLNNHPETGETLCIGCNLGPPPFGAGAHTRALYPLKIMHGTSQRSHHAKLGHPGTKRSCCGDCGAVSLRAGKDRESSRHHDLACRGALAGTSRSTP